MILWLKCNERQQVESRVARAFHSSPPSLRLASSISSVVGRFVACTCSELIVSLSCSSTMRSIPFDLPAIYSSFVLLTKRGSRKCCILPSPKTGASDTSLKSRLLMRGDEAVRSRLSVLVS